MAKLNKNMHCYGTSTIGPKGQVVIPAKLRKQMKINISDQFLVFQDSHFNGIILIKADDINHLLKHMTSELKKLEKSLKAKSKS